MAVLVGCTLLASGIIFLSLFVPKQNKVRADRVGGDPGLFGFKTLIAKFAFLLNGHEYVTTRYKEVRSQLSDYNVIMLMTLS
jgi:hypothetical protein